MKNKSPFLDDMSESNTMRRHGRAVSDMRCDIVPAYHCLHAEKCLKDSERLIKLVEVALALARG